MVLETIANILLKSLQKMKLLILENCIRTLTFITIENTLALPITTIKILAQNVSN